MHGYTVERILRISPFMMSKLFHPNSLDWSISTEGVSGCLSLVTCFVIKCNSDPDQTLHNLALHHLPVPLLWDVRYIWFQLNIHKSHEVGKLEKYIRLLYPR